MYDCNPIPELEIYKCRSQDDIDKLKRKYKIDQKIKIKIGQQEKEQIMKAYPEKEEDTILRLAR